MTGMKLERGDQRIPLFRELLAFVVPGSMFTEDRRPIGKREFYWSCMMIFSAFIILAAVARL
ncbi:MAG TPA: hypothetical protein VMM57_11110 [Bacteroidota bacterium]|nr:hypothetical protein [Bacteroidota bacterium]